MPVTNTIFALSTPYGRSGVGLFRVSGDLQEFDWPTLFSKESFVPRRASLCRLLDQTGATIDDVVVTFFPSPASFTGEDVLEFACHGSTAILDAVVEVLAAVPGWRLAQPGEFSRRAFRHGKMDLAEAEGLADVLEAKTTRQLHHAQQAAWGNTSNSVKTWRRKLIELQALAEAVIDFSEDLDDDIEAQILTTATTFARELSSAVTKGQQVAQLNAGYTVALVGAPNAGKSSLLNAMTNTDVAIVTDIAGTTRDQIAVETVIDGLPVKLIDTAGLRDTSDVVEQMGVERAQRLIETANLVVQVVHPDDDPEIIAEALTVFTHADVKDRSSEALSISSTTGAGVDSLLKAIGQQLSMDLPSPDDVAFSNVRQREAVSRAVKELESVSSDLPLDINGQHLRYAGQALAEVTGDVDVEDVLDVIFGNFCIGK